MLPLPFPSPRVMQGPRVNVPHSWFASGSCHPAYSQPSAPSPPSQHGGLIASAGYGYSLNHAHYSAECACWAKAVYAHSGAEVISLKIDAVHEVPGKAKPAIIAVSNQGLCLVIYFSTEWTLQNIIEGVQNVDTFVTPPDLIKIALNTMADQMLQKFLDFSWDWDTMIIQNSLNWVNLGKKDANTLYFYSRCLHVAKTGGTTFKTNKTPFPLSIVVKQKQ